MKEASRCLYSIVNFQNYIAFYTRKKLRVQDLVDESYKRINEVDDKVGAFLALNEDNARAYAKELDEALQTKDEFGLLFGMPIGVKDNIVTKDLRTTCSSKILANFDPIYDATVVQKIAGS